MDHTVRPCARPPHMVRRPRRVPLSPCSDAIPTPAAMCCRVSLPHSGSASSHVRAHPGPIPGALCNTSSLSRHTGLARRSVSRSSSSVARRALRQAIWASMSCARYALVPARRFCSRSACRPVAGGAHGAPAARASGPPAACEAPGRSRQHHAPACAQPTQRSWRVAPWHARHPGPVVSGQRQQAGPPWPGCWAPGVPGHPWLPAQAGWGGAPGGTPHVSPLRRHRWARPSAPRRGAEHYHVELAPHPYPQNRGHDSCGTPSKSPGSSWP
jgi:hypothetical protein